MSDVTLAILQASMDIEKLRVDTLHLTTEYEIGLHSRMIKAFEHFSDPRNTITAYDMISLGKQMIHTAYEASALNGIEERRVALALSDEKGL